MSTSTAAPVTVYVPRDSAARSVGADDVAAALGAPRPAPGRHPVVRNGSRGMLWLEPMVEVVTPEGRIGYGPVSPGTSTVWWPPACSTAPTTRCGSAWSRNCPGWRRRPGSPSPGSA